MTRNRIGQPVQLQNPQTGPAPETQAAPTPGRLAGLDGLRGLAMLMVIACHLNVLTIGWTGLSSFFVLSGFLITRILLGDRDSANTLGGYFRRFYMRRVLRVFPIYYVYLVVLAVAAYAVPRLAAIRGELPAAFLYYYNFHMILPHEHTRTLGHLWSLSVEEQFYLVWPWLIAFVPRAGLRAVCLLLIGAGPLIRLWVCDSLLPGLGLPVDSRLPIYTYIFTLSHLDAFAFGALLNFIRPKARDWQVGVTLLLTLLVGFAVNGLQAMDTLALGWPLFMSAARQYTWGYSVVDFFWFLVIAAIIGGHGVVKRLFTLPVLDFLGKRSYSTYIVHFPILAMMDPLWHSLMRHLGTLPGTSAFAVPYLAIVFGTSSLCFRFIEVPMSELKERFRASRKGDPGNPALESVAT